MRRSPLFPFFGLATAIVGSVGLVAQCASNALTTPPNFVFNGGGAVGGMMYFTIDVTASQGVRICGLDLNSGTTGPVQAEVFWHRTATRWQQLSGTNNTAADWCTIACLFGDGQVAGTPSTMAVANTTGTIDLPAGSHLLAIGNGSLSHHYTNGNGGNQTASDSNLRFDAGLAANTVYAAALFGPRILNATFHYEVATTPVARSPCGVACGTGGCAVVGQSCGARPTIVAERFDAQNPFDLNIGGTGSGNGRWLGEGVNAGQMQVRWQRSSVPLAVPVTSDLGLADDGISGPINVPLAMGVVGLPCASVAHVDSNGCVWIGDPGASDPTESVAELENGAARVCGFWTDLRPASGGGFGTITVLPTLVGPVVQYRDVEIKSSGARVSFDICLSVFGFEVIYDASSTFGDSAIVGYSIGVPTTATVSRDLSAASIALTTGAAAIDLRCEIAPTVGGALRVEIRNTPYQGALGLFATLGRPAAGASLPAPALPGCFDYLHGARIPLRFVPWTTPCSPLILQTFLPPNGAILGLELAAQAAAFVPAPVNGIVTSQALDTRVGL